ncbi:hypothetical protein GALL_512280 [mine drainage metagenome]|uniref:Uncharacterized protein n=1 Tax=mine drainage metagenome TaxID=410659 RepID=A0A1J5PPH3_9ZZZZ
MRQAKPDAYDKARRLVGSVPLLVGKLTSFLLAINRLALRKFLADQRLDSSPLISVSAVLVKKDLGRRSRT